MKTKHPKPLIIDYRKNIKSLLTKPFVDNDFESYFRYVAGHERQDVFALLKDYIPEEQYWKILSNVITEESFYNKDLKRWLTDKKNLSNRHLLMKDNEKKELNKLPEIVSIYRGEGNNRKGWSWTISKKVAMKFAKRHLLGKLLTGECEKRNIIAFINGRKEQEIIVPFRYVRSITVLQKYNLDDFTAPSDTISRKNELYQQNGRQSIYVDVTKEILSEINEQ